MRDWAAFFGYDVDRPEPVEPLVPELAAPLPPDRARAHARRTAFAVGSTSASPSPRSATSSSVSFRLRSKSRDLAQGAAWTP